MRKHITLDQSIPVLLRELMSLLLAHRAAFRQERTFLRCWALVLGEIFAFARHTVTQALLALGLTDSDWAAWYRLFSCQRYDEEKLSSCLFRQTLTAVKEDEPYVVGIDATQLERSSQKMPGTAWLPAPKTAPFRRGIHRAQRFEHIAWLPPIEEGYTRAIPLRFIPAFPAKAVPAGCAPRKEWEAGLELVRWVRGELDEAGRASEYLVTQGDGKNDTVQFWRELPEDVIAVVRTASNRRLREVPGPQVGRGRRRKYGKVVPSPGERVKERKGWRKEEVEVRGRRLEMRYRLEGPYLREGVPGRPLWLLVVGGQTWLAGKKERKRKQREPAYYLVSGVKCGDGWEVPLTGRQILSLTWQRWEMEVAHREMKSGFGVGEKQCWGKRSTVASVQWSVWAYSVLVLAGYRAWGWFGGPKPPGRWWKGSKRWSLNTLWRGYRSALWGAGKFRAIWTGTDDNWPKKESWLAGLYNAAASAARA